MKNTNSRKIVVSLLITTLFFIIQITGALISGSISLFADSIHMVTDIGAISIALFASILSQKPANYNKTFGYIRAEILASLFNGTLLWIAVFFIIKGSLERIRTKSIPNLDIMLIFATIGLVANIISAVNLYSGKKNLNIKAALFHALSDALSSCLVIITAISSKISNFQYADPLAAILITLFILINSILIVKNAVDVLMESVPKNIKVEEVIESVNKVPGVKDIHDLHIWTLSPGLDCMSCHISVDTPDKSEEMIARISDKLRNFGIKHITIQIERECRTPHIHT